MFLLYDYILKKNSEKCEDKFENELNFYFEKKMKYHLF